MFERNTLILKAVGCYEINSHLRFTFYKKPHWFHRKITKILLGWVWIDYEEKE